MSEESIQDVQEQAPVQDTEKQDLLDQLQRLQAEFHNYRNRVQRESEEKENQANEKLLREVLPIIDNLQLCVQHAKDETGTTKAEDLLTGIIMVLEQCEQFLEHQGIEKIYTDGQPFDPALHEAIIKVEAKDAKIGTIVQTYQHGYFCNGKLLRLAKVSVAK